MPDIPVVLTGGSLLARQKLALALQPVLQSLGHKAQLVCPDAPESLGLSPLPCQYLLWQSTAGQHALWRSALHALGVPYQVVQGDATEALKQAVYALLPPEQAQGWARQEAPPRWMGVCEACGDASCEQRLFGRLLNGSLKT